MFNWIFTKKREKSVNLRIFKKIEQCSYCGAMKNIHDMKVIMEGVFYCQECLRKLDHFVCEVCGKDWLFKKKYNKGQHGRTICHNCYSFIQPKYLELCNKCGKAIPIEQLTEIGKDKFLCCEKCLTELMEQADIYLSDFIKKRLF